MKMNDAVTMLFSDALCRDCNGREVAWTRAAANPHLLNELLLPYSSKALKRCSSLNRNGSREVRQNIRRTVKGLAINEGGQQVKQRAQCLNTSLIS
uniref:Uncharacterized protein n=1 Tax=Ascaris lumbricoides TaxID=6252 RepID=A0A0M3HK95_ASCLU